MYCCEEFTVAVANHHIAFNSRGGDSIVFAEDGWHVMGPRIAWVVILECIKYCPFCGKLLADGDVKND